MDGGHASGALESRTVHSTALWAADRVSLDRLELAGCDGQALVVESALLCSSRCSLSAHLDDTGLALAVHRGPAREPAPTGSTTLERCRPHRIRVDGLARVGRLDHVTDAAVVFDYLRAHRRHVPDAL